MPNDKKPITAEEEKINIVLDTLHPKARSRTVVEYDGKNYQLRYFPLEKTEDGVKVKEWGHRWIIFRGPSGK